MEGGGDAPTPQSTPSPLVPAQPRQRTPPEQRPAWMGPLDTAADPPPGEADPPPQEAPAEPSPPASVQASVQDAPSPAPEAPSPVPEAPWFSGDEQRKTALAAAAAEPEARPASAQVQKAPGTPPRCPAISAEVSPSSAAETTAGGAGTPPRAGRPVVVPQLQGLAGLGAASTVIAPSPRRVGTPGRAQQLVESVAQRQLEGSLREEVSGSREVASAVKGKKDTASPRGAKSRPSQKTRVGNLEEEGTASVAEEEKKTKENGKSTAAKGSGLKGGCAACVVQ